MIVGLGIDIVNIHRIEKLLERFPKRTPELLLTKKEQENMPTIKQKKITYIASRFAAKEAAVKALGTGFQYGITIQNVEVSTNSSGKPTLELNGNAQKKAKQMNITYIHLSITHEKEHAAAIVIMESTK